MLRCPLPRATIRPLMPSTPSHPLNDPAGRTDLYHGLFLLARRRRRPAARVAPRRRSVAHSVSDDRPAAARGDDRGRHRRDLSVVRRPAATAASSRSKAICEWPTPARSAVSSSGSPARSPRRVPRLALRDIRDQVFGHRSAPRAVAVDRAPRGHADRAQARRARLGVAVVERGDLGARSNCSTARGSRAAPARSRPPAGGADRRRRSAASCTT